MTIYIASNAESSGENGDCYDERVTQPQYVPNWYPDPYNPSQLRYYDGIQWTQNTCPVPAKTLSQPTVRQEKRKITCPKCGSGNIFIQPITQIATRQRGCFAWTLWILLAICTIGLILIIIPAFTNSKTSYATRTQCVCQNCGHRWLVKAK